MYGWQQWNSRFSEDRGGLPGEQQGPNNDNFGGGGPSNPNMGWGGGRGRGGGMGEMQFRQQQQQQLTMTQRKAQLIMAERAMAQQALVERTLAERERALAQRRNELLEEANAAEQRALALLAGDKPDSGSNTSKQGSSPAVPPKPNANATPSTNQGPQAAGGAGGAPSKWQPLKPAENIQPSAPIMDTQAKSAPPINGPQKSAPPTIGPQKPAPSLISSQKPVAPMIGPQKPAAPLIGPQKPDSKTTETRKAEAPVIGPQKPAPPAAEQPPPLPPPSQNSAPPPPPPSPSQIPVPPQEAQPKKTDAKIMDPAAMLPTEVVAERERLESLKQQALQWQAQQQQQHQYSMGQIVGQPMGYPMAQPLGQPLGQPMGQPMGYPMGQPMGQPMVQTMGNPMMMQQEQMRPQFDGNANQFFQPHPMGMMNPQFRVENAPQFNPMFERSPMMDLNFRAQQQPHPHMMPFGPQASQMPFQQRQPFTPDEQQFGGVGPNFNQANQPAQPAAGLFKGPTDPSEPHPDAAPPPIGVIGNMPREEQQQQLDPNQSRPNEFGSGFGDARSGGDVPPAHMAGFEMEPGRGEPYDQRRMAGGDFSRFDQQQQHGFNENPMMQQPRMPFGPRNPQEFEEFQQQQLQQFGPRNPMGGGNNRFGHPNHNNQFGMQQRGGGFGPNTNRFPQHQQKPTSLLDMEPIRPPASFGPGQRRFGGGGPPFQPDRRMFDDRRHPMDNPAMDSGNPNFVPLAPRFNQQQEEDGGDSRFGSGHQAPMDHDSRFPSQEPRMLLQRGPQSEMDSDRGFPMQENRFQQPLRGPQSEMDDQRGFPLRENRFQQPLRGPHPDTDFERGFPTQESRFQQPLRGPHSDMDSSVASPMRDEAARNQSALVGPSMGAGADILETGRLSVGSGGAIPGSVEDVFEKQLFAWNRQFEIWREQNKDHPDRKAYFAYEKQWQEWKDHLIRRHAQMKLLRTGSGAAPLTAADKESDIAAMKKPEAPFQSSAASRFPEISKPSWPPGETDKVISPVKKFGHDQWSNARESRFDDDFDNFQSRRGIPIRDRFGNIGTSTGSDTRRDADPIATEPRYSRWFPAIEQPPALGPRDIYTWDPDLMEKESAAAVDESPKEETEKSAESPTDEAGGADTATNAVPEEPTTPKPVTDVASTDKTKSPTSEAAKSDPNKETGTGDVVAVEEMDIEEQVEEDFTADVAVDNSDSWQEPDKLIQETIPTVTGKTVLESGVTDHADSTLADKEPGTKAPSEPSKPSEPNAETSKQKEEPPPGPSRVEPPKANAPTETKNVSAVSGASTPSGSNKRKPSPTRSPDKSEQSKVARADNDEDPWKEYMYMAEECLAERSPPDIRTRDRRRSSLERDRRLSRSPERRPYNRGGREEESSRHRLDHRDDRPSSRISGLGDRGGDVSRKLLEDDRRGDVSRRSLIDDRRGDVSRRPVDDDRRGDVSRRPVDDDRRGDIGRRPVDDDRRGDISRRPVDDVYRGDRPISDQLRSSNRSLSPTRPSRDGYRATSPGYVRADDARRFGAAVREPVFAGAVAAGRGDRLTASRFDGEPRFEPPPCWPLELDNFEPAPDDRRVEREFSARPPMGRSRSPDPYADPRGALISADRSYATERDRAEIGLTDSVRRASEAARRFVGDQSPPRQQQRWSQGDAISAARSDLGSFARTESLSPAQYSRQEESFTPLAVGGTITRVLTEKEQALILKVAEELTILKDPKGLSSLLSAVHVPPVVPLNPPEERSYGQNLDSRDHRSYDDSYYSAHVQPASGSKSQYDSREVGYAERAVDRQTKLPFLESQRDDDDYGSQYGSRHSYRSPERYRDDIRREDPLAAPSTSNRRSFDAEDAQDDWRYQQGRPFRKLAEELNFLREQVSKADDDIIWDRANNDREPLTDEYGHAASHLSRSDVDMKDARLATLDYDQRSVKLDYDQRPAALDYDHRPTALDYDQRSATLDYDQRPAASGLHLFNKGAMSSAFGSNQMETIEYGHGQPPRMRSPFDEQYPPKAQVGVSGRPITGKLEDSRDSLPMRGRTIDEERSFDRDSRYLDRERVGGGIPEQRQPERSRDVIRDYERGRNADSARDDRQLDREREFERSRDPEQARRDLERVRDQDRGRDMDRGRDYERGRDTYRRDARMADRDDSRDRDRERDRDRDRERDRSRERSWERERLGNRYPGGDRRDDRDGGNRNDSRMEPSRDRFGREQQAYKKAFPIDTAYRGSPKSSSSSSKTAVLIDDLLGVEGRKTRPAKMVFILRGAPGSGKTFVAKLIKDKEIEYGGSAPRIMCLDDYFMVEVDKNTTDKDGRIVTVKSMVYEYEEALEESYRGSLFKTFKKTVEDGFFPFIIVDAINNRLKHFFDLALFAKQKGFQVFIIDVESDYLTCCKRSTHGHKPESIKRMIANWEPTSHLYTKVDIRSLLQDASITEVEMEDSTQVPKNTKSSTEKSSSSLSTSKGDPDIVILDDEIVLSKWEKMEATEDKLDKLDGLHSMKKKKDAPSLEDYLQLPDDYEERQSQPDRKRVRWADIEEGKDQQKKRALGFVIGQTDWKKMTDPKHAQNALIRTKYI